MRGPPTTLSNPTLFRLKEGNNVALVREAKQDLDHFWYTCPNSLQSLQHSHLLKLHCVNVMEMVVCCQVDERRVQAGGFTNCQQCMPT